MASSSHERAQEVAVVDLVAAIAGEDALPEAVDLAAAISGEDASSLEAVDLAAAAREAVLPPEDLVLEGGQAGTMRTDRSGGHGGDWLEAWSGGNGGGRLEAWFLMSMGCYSLYQHMGPMHARFVYGVLFLIANFTAWGLRENPILFFQRQRLSGCHGNRDCFAAEAVLMSSFTVFLFFFAMFLSTVFTRSIHDLRNTWHSKRWELKIVLLASCFVISKFAPTSMTQLYGKVAPFGAGLFLIIQLISVIRYITRLNSRWCGQANFDNHRRKVNMISTLAFGCSNVGILIMAFWYMSSYLDAVLIYSTLGLVYFMPLVSSLTKAKGFYMEPLLMGVYIVLMCWSAIKSEPYETSSYKKENTGSSVNWITVISFIAEVASVTVAAFSTGTDYKCIQFKNVVESENDIPYGYGFFHFVFATSSMYFGMLFIGWDTHHVSERWSMDVGWTSTIVHLVNEALAVIFYVVVLLARCYGIGWLQQLLGKMFGIGGQQLADESRATRQQESEPPQAPHVTEPVGRESDDAPRPSSSSSTTMAGPPLDLRTSEPPQAPAVVGRQYGEIREEW